MRLQLPVDIVAVAQILDWSQAVLFDGNNDALLDDNTRKAFAIVEDTFNRVVHAEARFLALQRVQKYFKPLGGVTCAISS